MKKLLCILLCLIITISLVACSEGESGEQEKDSEKLSDVQQSVKASQPTTLMIYMIGSDLEAKGASATNDMKEILESGVNLEANNVIVYGGGTKRWHNDDIAADDGHTMLKLTPDGFEEVDTFSEASMGEAKTLADFLTVAYNQFPSENYALVLWDHGNGPLIGYGKDMLHEDDSLTLMEMKEAMEASPFKDKKLAFVGFDACLMSSLELALTWSDYANYMVASQEIEPAFGWNYSFLKDLGTSDTESFLKNLTDTYLTTCLDYYLDRGYDQRDTTLAAIDLSKINVLKDSVEALSKKATADVENKYSLLVEHRVNTRALGRATTGSEYDLIDLFDMAEQLKATYPDEATAVQNALNDAVISNSTNTVGCSGLSIYYPFYNKKYYEKTWGDVYSKLNLLPEYTAYLASYTEEWLGNDKLLTVAQSTMPTVSKGKYTLNLSAEQSDAYAEASYYILQKTGDSIYTRIYASKDVTKSGNTLSANFDGQIIYGKNKFDQYFIPATIEHDTVGNQTRYSIYVNLCTEYAVWGDEPDDFESEVLGHYFHISANKETKEIKTSALVPYNVEVSSDALNGGKLQDADLSNWSFYNFLLERHKYLERYENGTIKSYSEWKNSDYFAANKIKVNDGLEFLFAPIPEGEYYVMFEIKDTQGNLYSSEPMPISEKGGTFDRQYFAEPVNLNWTSGNEILLIDKENVKLYLTTTKTTKGIEYILKATNNNDFDIAVIGNEIMYNDSIYCPDATLGSFIVPAGETKIASYELKFGDSVQTIMNTFSFGDAADLEMMNDLSSLDFTVTVTDAYASKTLIYNQEFIVKLSKETTFIPPVDSFTDNYYHYNMPTRNILAKEQLVFEKDGIKGYLLGLGSNGADSKMIFAMRFENTTDTYKYFSIDGFVFDNVYIEHGTGPITLIPNASIYKLICLSEDKLDTHMVTSPTKVKINVLFMQEATLKGGGGFSEQVYYNITLSQEGSGSSITEGEKVLYDENGIRITLLKAEAEESWDNYNTVRFYCTLSNNTDQGIVLTTYDATINGIKWNRDQIFSGLLIKNNVCGANQQTSLTIVCDTKDTYLNLEFTPLFYNLTQEKILWESTSKITLNFKGENWNDYN